MMDTQLVCNLRKCRKRVKNRGFVTSCSHVFCEEDGIREFQKGYVCPACQVPLPNKFDIMALDLQMAEAYKTLILAGQSPETIIEIALRGLTFWTYQMQVELNYQEHISSKTKEKYEQLQRQFDDCLTGAKTHIASLNKQLAAVKKDLESLKSKLSEVTEKLQEKTRQNQKLQMMYEALRRKGVGIGSFNDISPARPPIPGLSANWLPGQNVTGPMSLDQFRDSLHRRNSGSGGSGDDRFHRSSSLSPAEKEFVLRPNTTPTTPTERLHNLSALRIMSTPPERRSSRN